MKKKEIEILLSKLERIKKPKIKLEQYSTPTYIVSDILFKAFMNGDIKGKVICDLGCGNGIFGIGAKILGAKEVIFVDRDKKAIEIAKENCRKLKLSGCKFINKDVIDLKTKCQTSFSNPPYGIQSKEYEKFTSAIPKISNVSYVLLPAGREFGKIIGRYRIKIPRMFHFHEKKEYEFFVECFLKREN